MTIVQSAIKLQLLYPVIEPMLHTAYAHEETHPQNVIPIIIGSKYCYGHGCTASASSLAKSNESGVGNAAAAAALAAAPFRPKMCGKASYEPYISAVVGKGSKTPVIE